MHYGMQHMCAIRMPLECHKREAIPHVHILIAEGALFGLASVK